MRVSFEEFTFDASRQVLSRGSQNVHLTPKEMCLLELLLNGRGKVIPEQELVDCLWPDVVVSGASLKNLVSILRTNLGEPPHGRSYIRNVRGRGYVLDAPITELCDEPPVHSAGYLHYAGRIIPLHPGSNLVGRDYCCSVRLLHSSVSRRHATIVLATDRVTLEDLGSRNGTFLDGAAVSGVCRLEHDHQLTFGRLATYYTASTSDDSTLSVSSRLP